MARRPDLGDDVIVVGGGNTAMDCVPHGRDGSAPKTSGCSIAGRAEEMPCLMEEVEGAEAEGVQHRVSGRPGPTRAAAATASLLVTCIRMELGEPDDSGRRRPVPIPGSEFNGRADTVIAAIGQAVDCSLAADEGLKRRRGALPVDPGR